MALESSPDADPIAQPPATPAAGAWRASGLRSWLGARVTAPRTWIVVAAFALRLAWVLLVPSKPVGDFALYREAAAYLVEHGHLDPEFIYMPGYVFVLAAVQACGGGLLAAKMVGVVAGTLVASSVGGIAAALFGARAGVVASALAALWPAGIAVASVTGTDVPAAALLTLGLFVLVRWGPTRPWCAAVASGAALGLGAWVRAAAVPLVALSFLYWLAIGVRAPAALARAATSVAVALLILLPWGLRNQRVTGELSFADNHGGHTALVGSNPNSEGTYSRSLNLMFTLGTGYRLFEPPARHLDSDRAAYALAKQWARFELAYALGLVAAKADRLLGTERNLLYWPVFRAGVLPDSARLGFDAHRAGIERAVDWTWWAVVALAAAGIAIAARRRAWDALALLAFPVALAGVYALFFSEVRYHLSIAPLLFPYAAVTVDCFGRRGARRDLVLGALAASASFAVWQAGIAVGASLRADHRWAVSVCAYPYETQLHLCSWQRVLPREGPSPVRGTWDAVGIDIGNTVDDDVLASARTVVPLDSRLGGALRVRARISLTERDALRLRDSSVTVALRADGRVIARTAPLVAYVPSAHASSPSENAPAGRFGGARAGEISVVLVGEVTHVGGPLVLDAEVERAGASAILDGKTVWIADLVVERWPGLEIMPAP